MTESYGVQIVDEGLYIVGWVAMWRPLEIFLYDWRPIWHRLRLFAKLATVPVAVRMTRVTPRKQFIDGVSQAVLSDDAHR